MLLFYINSILMFYPKICFRKQDPATTFHLKLGDSSNLQFLVLCVSLLSFGANVANHRRQKAERRRSGTFCRPSAFALLGLYISSNCSIEYLLSYSAFAEIKSVTCIFSQTLPTCCKVSPKPYLFGNSKKFVTSPESSAMTTCQHLCLESCSYIESCSLSFGLIVFSYVTCAPVRGSGK